MAKIIKADGQVIEVSPKNGSDFKLDELKAIVNGYIEPVYLNDEQMMVVNEEGKLYGLPVNLIATEIYNITHQPHTDVIVGDVLFCKRNEVK